MNKVEPQEEAFFSLVSDYYSSERYYIFCLPTRKLLIYWRWTRKDIGDIEKQMMELDPERATETFSRWKDWDVRMSKGSLPLSWLTPEEKSHISVVTKAAFPGAVEYRPLCYRDASKWKGEVLAVIPVADLDEEQKELLYPWMV